MSANVETMSDKDTLIPRHEHQGHDHIHQGRDHVRLTTQRCAPWTKPCAPRSQPRDHGRNHERPRICLGAPLVHAHLMIAGLIRRPLLFSRRRFSCSASVGADSSTYSVTASNDACFFLDSNMPTYISTIVADLLIHRRLRKRTIPRLQTFFPPSPLLPRTPTTTRSAMRGYLLRALSKPTNVHQCSK